MLKRKNKIENNKGSKSQLIIVGSLLIILGTLIIGGKYLYNYLETKNEEQLIDTFFEEQKEITEDTTPEVPEEKVETEKPQPTKTKIDYFAVIKIPKIGLEKGLANKGSYYNNVNRNILVVKESDMPDKDKGNVILAGHSGSGRTAYFKNLHKLERDDEVNIFFTDKHVLFEFDNTIVLSRLIEGEYYKIDKMLSSDYETKVTVNKREMLDCIDRTTLLIKESEKKPVIIDVKDNSIGFAMNSSIGSMDEEIDATKEGKDILIGFNPRFLMDALRVIDEEEITMYMINPKAPCFIRDKDETYIYLILPVNFNV